MALRRCSQVAKLVKLAQDIGSQGDAGVQKHIKRCLKKAPGLDGTDLTHLAGSLATLKCQDKKTWQKIGDVVTQKMREIKVAELMKISGSFSVASQQNKEMLSAIAARIKEHSAPVGLTCRSWADFIVSLNRSKIRVDLELLKDAGDAVVNSPNSLNGSKTCYILAFVEASITTQFFHPEMFTVLSELLVNRIHHLNAHDLSRVALACGQATCKNDALLHSLCKALHRQLPVLPANRISYTVHGLSLLDCPDTELLTQLAKAWTAAGPSEPIEVVHMMSALAKSKVLDASLCNQFAASSLHCVSAFNARNLATVLGICGQVRCTHVEFLESLAKAASHKLSEFSASNLCELSFAAGKLSLSPILGTCVPAAVVGRMSEFRGAELALLMHGVSRLSSNPSRYLPALEHAALDQVTTLKPADLRYICMAWVKGRAAEPALMEAVATRALEKIDSLDPSTISHLAWAYSKLQFANTEFFEALGARCADTVSFFATPRLAHLAAAFVRVNLHHEMPLINIAKEALTKFRHMHPASASLLARTFIQVDLDSPAIEGLLDGLAAHACREGWIGLRHIPLEDQRIDFQKQCAEMVRDFLPSILVNQRHEMGPLLTMFLEQKDGSLVNLEVDPIDIQLSPLDRVVRGRRDEFLEKLGVHVLRLKVGDMDDLRYHLQHIFGDPVMPSVDDIPAEVENSQPEKLDGQLEAPISCPNQWEQMEPGGMGLGQVQRVLLEHLEGCSPKRKLQQEEVAKLAKLAERVGTASQADSGVPKHIQRCLKGASNLQANDLVDLSWSMATLRYKDEKTWQQIGDVVTQKVGEIAAGHMVAIARSFSITGERNAAMMRRMVEKIKERPSDLTSWSWADFILTLQRSKVKPDAQLLKAAADIMLTDVDALERLSTQHILAFVALSYDAAAFRPWMFQVLSHVLVKQMHSLNPLELSRVAMVCGQAACSDKALLQSLCEAIRRKLPSFPRNRISYTIYGLSLLQCNDLELLYELATAWTAKGPEEPIEVVHVMSALKKSQALDSALCNRIAACSSHCVPRFDAKSIATILGMCWRFQCADSKFIESLAKAADQNISEFNASDLCEVAFAACKLSLAPILGASVAAAVVARVSEFKGSQLALSMHAVSRLSSNPRKYLPALEHAALDQVSTLKPADLKYICMAWVQGRAAEPALMEAVATQALEIIDCLDPSTISHLAWAYSKLQFANTEFFEALGARCADTVSFFATPRLAHLAAAFVRVNLHHEMPLINIAKEALTKFRHMHPASASLLARTFIQVDLDSPAIEGLLDGLAAHACREGWIGLRHIPLEDQRIDFQKQCAEMVRDFLPSILVNQRHEMGPLLTMFLEQKDGSLVNLEVDPIDIQLSPLDRVVRGRRDEFLEKLGVHVLRLKVGDMDDLRYHLQHIFGDPVMPSVDDIPAEVENSQPEKLDGQLEAPILCPNQREHMEPGGLQSQGVM